MISGCRLLAYALLAHHNGSIVVRCPRFARPSEWMNQTFLSPPKTRPRSSGPGTLCRRFVSANRQEPAATVPRD